MKKVRLKIILLAMALGGCEYNSIPILRGLPDDIFFLSLSHNSSSNTIVANGKNQVQFTITAYNIDKVPIQNYTTNHFKQLKIEVNDVMELSYPFTFSTTLSGIYSFKIQGLSSEFNLSKEIKITANKGIVYELITIPIIFHSITNINLSISEKNKLHELLKKNLHEVNKAFIDDRGSSDPNAANPSIKFVLADKNPESNILEMSGLNFIYSPLPSFGTIQNTTIEDLIWNGNFWPPKKYLNIWIAPLDDNFSWAYFPDFSPSNSYFPSRTYGVVYNSKHLYDYNVLIHELGHTLNLLHVFDSYCGDPDFCSDTWSYRRSYNDFTSRWQVRKTTCRDEEFYSNNYMDYFPCANNTFTQQQVLRMQNTIQKYPFIPTVKNSAESGKIIVNSRQRLRNEDDIKFRIY